MVFADADEIGAGLVGEHGFVDDVANGLRVREQLAVRAARDVAEGVQAELDRGIHVREC